MKTLKRLLPLLAMIVLLIAVLAVSVSAVESEKLIPMDQLLKELENRTVMAEHPYAEVIRGAIREESTIGYMEGFGTVYDVDGNGTLELMLVYPAYVYDYGNYFEGVVYSIYTMSGNAAIPLVEQTELFILAGGPAGSIQVVKKDGKNYIAVHEENYDGGYVGSWVLYDVNGNSITIDTTIEYKDYDVGSDYAIINGAKCNYSQYRSWLNSLSTIIRVDIPAYEGQDDPNAYSLYDLLSYVKNLPPQNHNGLVCVDGVWGYYIDGVLQTDFTDLVYYEGNFYYVVNGILSFDYTGLVPYMGNYYYVENSVLNWGYTGLTLYNGVWYYVQNGALQWGYYGLVCHNGAWYYVENSAITWTYTGLVEYCGTWFYVENSCINWGYSSLYLYNGTWYVIQGGQLIWGYYGLVCYNDFWFYAENSLITFTFTGLAEYEGILFYFEGSCLNWSYNGKATYNGMEYDVVNGMAFF